MIGRILCPIILNFYISHTINFSHFIPLLMKKTTSPQPQRLESLDAFRGFDMIWIMGLPAVIYALEKIFGGPIFEFLSLQMKHAKWDGLHFMDLVFPTFLFIAGCSFPFSLRSRLAKGDKHSSILKHIFKRAFLLVLLGCVYNGILNFDFENMRYASVLGRIGIAWMFGTLLYVYFHKSKIFYIFPAILLVAYSLLLGLVPSPSAGEYASIYDMNATIVGWVDQQLLPGRLLVKETFDPEGILSTIPAISTALLGIITGRVLLTEPNKLKYSKTALILGGGVVLIILGYLLSIIEPINKSLWSSSFTLVAGGISAVSLAIFYWLIDVKKWKKGVFFFQIIGLNSLLIYLAQRIVSFKGINQFFLNGLASCFSENLGELILAIGYVAICWLFLYYLYQKKTFLKV